MPDYKDQTDSPWFISDVSGFKYPLSEAVKGAPPENELLMHISEYSAYNPQFKIKGRPDNTSVGKDARPRTPDVFDTSFPSFD